MAMSSMISIQIQIMNFLIFALMGYSVSIITGSMKKMENKLNILEFVLYISFVLYIFIVDNASLIHNVTNYLWYFHGSVMLATELQLGIITYIQIGRYYRRNIWKITQKHLIIINIIVTFAFSAWAFVGQNAYVENGNIVYTHDVITVTVTSIYHVLMESIMQYCIFNYIYSIKGLKTKASLILKLCLLSSILFVSWLIILPILNMTVKNQNLILCYRIDILIKCMIISLPRFLSKKKENQKDQITTRGTFSAPANPPLDTYYDKSNLIGLKDISSRNLVNSPSSHFENTQNNFITNP
jgi:hypothetical protein